MKKLLNKLRVRISVIIPTCNRSRSFHRTLLRLLDQNINKKTYEIIVVDNGNTDKVDTVVKNVQTSRSFPVIRYRYIATQGVNKARNEGITLAQGKIIAFCDDDVIVSRTWLADIVQAHRDFPHADAIGGKVEPVWPYKKPFWITQQLKNYLALVDFGEYPVRNPIGLVSANLSFKRSAFRKYGEFNELLGRKKGSFMFKDEFELLERIKLHKGELRYVPTVVVNHVISPRRLTVLFMMKRVFWEGRSEAKMDELWYRDNFRHFLSVLNQPFRDIMKTYTLEYLFHIVRELRNAIIGFFVHVVFITGYLWQRIFIKNYKVT